MPLNEYLYIIIPSVTPHVKPLKNIIIMTPKTPSMDKPNININNNCKNSLLNVFKNSTYSINCFI